MNDVASDAPGAYRAGHVGVNSFAETTGDNVADGAGDTAASTELDGAADRLGRSEDPTVEEHSEFDDGAVDAGSVDLDASALVDRLVDGSVEELDGLIAALQTLRDHLHAEGQRVQGEISVFARVGDSAMQTTMVIGKAIGQWRGAAQRRA